MQGGEKPRPHFARYDSGVRNQIASSRLTDRVAVGFRPGDSKRTAAMKTIVILLTVAALGLAAEPADAKGCLKGAAVGGVAGHYAGHHGLLGAAAGCIYGRRHAREQERLKQQQQQPPAGQEKL
jgi:hypothetical protein